MLENILKASEYKELLCSSLLFDILFQIEDVTVNYYKILTLGSYMYDFFISSLVPGNCSACFSASVADNLWV